ncbi:MAG: 50S ribosomal protein L11 methyltransferase [Lachnospiraceae bacterium]|nr:50S ribosomal protein L11 methyltransferase [Lachnospiraceae bacterium]
MKYIRYTIKSVKDAEDIIAALLTDLDVEGVVIEDASLPDDIRENGTFYDVLPENNIEGDDAFVSFFIEESKNRDSILSDVSEMLRDLESRMNIGDGGISVSETEDKDWLNNWKEFFKSFVIDFEDGKSALFIPSWEMEKVDKKPEQDYVINIDPGTAFGTGAHESTRLCIRAMEKYVKPGCRFLDVGAGSGILSLLAFKFGAVYGIGTDIDEGAVPAVHDNFEKNGLSDADYHLLIGNIIDDQNARDHVGFSYDLIVANILPNVLIPLTDYIPEMLKPGGIYITSGIIDYKAEEMKKNLTFNDFEILEENHDGEWVSYVSVLR